MMVCPMLPTDRAAAAARARQRNIAGGDHDIFTPTPGSGGDQAPWAVTEDVPAGLLHQQPAAKDEHRDRTVHLVTKPPAHPVQQCPRQTVDSVRHCGDGGRLAPDAFPNRRLGSHEPNGTGAGSLVVPRVNDVSCRFAQLGGVMRRIRKVWGFQSASPPPVR